MSLTEELSPERQFVCWEVRPTSHYGSETERTFRTEAKRVWDERVETIFDVFDLRHITIANAPKELEDFYAKREQGVFAMLAAVPSERRQDAPIPLVALRKGLANALNTWQQDMEPVYKREGLTAEQAAPYMGTLLIPPLPYPGTHLWTPDLAA